MRLKALRHLEQALTLEDQEFIDQIASWNDKIEGLMKGSPEEQLKTLIEPALEEAEEDSNERGLDVSRKLLRFLLNSLEGSVSIRHDGDYDINERVCELQLAWSQSHDEGDAGGARHATMLVPKSSDSVAISKVSRPILSEILRTCKIWLRWFLQIFQPSHRGVAAPDLIHDFKSKNLLKLYLTLLNALCSVGDEDGARHASQIFFFSTFNPVTGMDDQLQKSFEYLSGEHNLFEQLLRLLLRAQTAPLALSLVRNVHNALVSFPKAAQHVTDTTLLAKDLDYRLAPWALLDGQPHADTPFLFKPVLRNIVDWAIHSEPKFPGAEHDLRGELVVEILRAYYALRMGSQLTVPSKDERLESVVTDLLKLDHTDRRCFECQHVTVTLLMDSSPEFSNVLIKHEAVGALLLILEHQVDAVVKANQISNATAAAVAPILVVIHNYCQANGTFRAMAKERVFPDEEEKVKEESKHERHLFSINLHHNNPPKNMSPTDAPHGTLRALLIRLLTWPQGHIKRFAGELLWILCDSDSNEFVRRVGMGNALPVLHNKNVVELPGAMTGQG